MAQLLWSTTMKVKLKISDEAAVNLTAMLLDPDYSEDYGQAIVSPDSNYCVIGTVVDGVLILEVKEV